MSERLVFDDHRLVQLGSRTFAWIDIKRFTIATDGSDAELLGALIDHPQYGDHYAGQDPAEQDQHELHGPYRLDAIKPETFQATDRATARQVIDDWTASWDDDDDHLTPEALAAVAEHTLPVLDAAAVYRLPDLRATAEHDWGWVVGSGGFLEFVAIDRPSATLTLLVASDD